MTATAMLMKEIETLPEESVKETLDFVLFLQMRKKNMLKDFSEGRFPSMSKPIHLGFDIRKISREELYER